MKILSIDEAKRYVGDKKRVIITGTTGQDGSFMVEYLLKNTDYTIFGGSRRLSVENHKNIEHLRDNPRFHLINFDLTDTHSISQLINNLQPSYFINFAAQSFVKSSWDFPIQTWETNATAIIHILEAIRLHCPDCRSYNAGSSEEFGNVQYSPQDEKHPMSPRSPYGASKAAARQIVKVYRESYNLYTIQGWLHNHESCRRGEEFVTRKITKGIARIVGELKRGLPVVPIELGNLDARRDWSDAEDCIDAVWRMLNQEQYNSKRFNLPRGGLPITSSGFVQSELVKHLKEYVVSSGTSHTIREFVELAFKYAGIENICWDGDAADETLWYKDEDQNPHLLVKINPAFYRPSEVENLLGNPSEIKNDLGWIPKTSFEGLVKKMVANDLKSPT
jgi:GDPmannose 4,6-dehydratase